MSHLTCQQARHLFDAYLDGELSASMSTELDAHRFACPECRQALALLEVTGHMLKADRDVPGVGDDFTDRLLACIGAPAPIPLWRRARVLWAGGGLAAAAAIALAFTFNSSPPNKRVLEYKEAAPVTMTGAARGELKGRVDEQVSAVQDSTVSLADFGKLTVLQILDRLGIERVEPTRMFGSPKPAGPVQPAPASDAGSIEDL